MLLTTGFNGVPQRKPTLLANVVQSATDNQPISISDANCYRKMTPVANMTQDLPQINDLDEGWMFWYGNQSAFDITLRNPSGQLVDGLTSYVMYPEEIRCFYIIKQNDQMVIESLVMNGFVKTFTVSGTFTKAPGYIAFEGFLWAGGGSGSKDASGATGGSGGSCVPFSIAASSFGTSEVITIATAATGPSVNSAGVVGGNSTIGAILTAFGGSAGTSNTTAPGGAGTMGIAAAAVGGAPGGGAANIDSAFGGGGGGSVDTGAAGKSFYGGGGAGYGSVGSGLGGDSQYGGAGGGGVNSLTARAGGTSKFGGNGGASANNTSGIDGSAPSGGGGGTRSGTKAGDGARGQLRITGKF